MKNLFSVWSFLMLSYLPANALTGNQPLDSLNEARLRSIVEEYLHVFTISDMRGNYLTSFEEKMQGLFSDDAIIYNFLPGTPSYRQHIPLIRYIEEASRLAREVIIQPGVTDYRISHITEVQPGEQWLVTASINKDIVIYSKEFDKLAAFILPVKMLVDVRQAPGVVRILSLSNDTPGWVDLDFLVLLPDAKAAVYKKIGFRHAKSRGQPAVNRMRNSDHLGKVSLSLVPSGVPLYISPPPGYNFVRKLDRTGEDWFHTPLPDRVLMLEAVGRRQLLAMWLRAGSSYQMTEASHYVQIENMSDFYSEGEQVNVQPSVSYFLNLALPLRHSGRRILALGTGLEYHSTSFNMHVERSEQLFPAMTDTDEDMFELQIIADNIQEAYRHESFAVPLFVTWRWLTNNKWIASIDLNTKLLYHFPAKYSVQSTLTQTTKGYYPEYNLTLHDLPSYGYKTSMFDEERPLSAIINKEIAASFSIELAFGLPLLENQLWLQPAIAYKAKYVGGGESAACMPEDRQMGNAYSYISSLAYRQIGLGQLSAGISLLLLF